MAFFRSGGNRPILDLWNMLVLDLAIGVLLMWASSSFPPFKGEIMAFFRSVGNRSNIDLWNLLVLVGLYCAGENPYPPSQWHWSGVTMGGIPQASSPATGEVAVPSATSPF